MSMEFKFEGPALRKIWRMRTIPLLAPIWLYKKCLSPLLPPACRHYPTCSEYAFEAIKQRGIAQGMVMGAWRVLRCNPFGTRGYDPVEAFRWPWQKPAGDTPSREELQDGNHESSRIVTNHQT